MIILFQLLKILDLKLLMLTFFRYLFRSIDDHDFLQQYFKLFINRVQFEGRFQCAFSLLILLKLL